MTIDGIININKPEGWTSQDVCAKLRSRLHIRKIGHTGTLDPMATGVLPVCIGKATRIIEYYDTDLKSYHAEMKLGIETDTLDVTGEVIGTNDFSSVTEQQVLDAFAAYTGTVSQIPPKYSALRVNGKRAYDLAREGADFTLASREITIVSNEVTDLRLKDGIIGFDVTCSKGTYIRTMCDDIGRSLGCGAAMTALTRTGSGYFRIEDATDINEAAGMTDEEIEKLVIPMDETLMALGKIEIDDNRVIAFINGNPSSERCLKITEVTGYPEVYRIYGNAVTSDGRVSMKFLGTGELKEGTLTPLKVLFDPRG